MKFVVTFKDPDYMIDGAEKSKVEKILGKFLEYDEYLTIEIDTEKKTAKVLEA